MRPFSFRMLNYCCTFPLPSYGVGNFTNEPALVDYAGGNLRLQSNSPCINAGNNACATNLTDLDGNPRIKGGTVDAGAYEFQSPASVVSYAWLRHFGLPVDGSADSSDPDSDRMNNWQEWQADTNPTNASSCLSLTLATNGSPVTVQFLSSSNRLYTLHCATNLHGAPWISVPGQADIPGTGGWQTLNDTNTVGNRFYRVSVRLP